MNFKKSILLTGAGFTANFGGLLATQMWSKILNNPKIDQAPEIKKLLMDDFDFESVYSKVINNSTYSQQVKDLLQSIIQESYASMDGSIEAFVSSGFNQYRVWWGGVSTFLGMFAGTQGQTGMHFTLNQDLLMERAVHKQQLGISATQYRDHWNSISQGRPNLSSNIILPNDSELAEFKDKHFESTGDMCYIKLHGSQMWFSASGKQQMVLGFNKLEDIKKEPLLNWYFELFQSALESKDVSLFVIGYSFRDEHINNLILKAIEEQNLKLIIISPEAPEKLKARLEGRPDSPSTIWETSKYIKIWEAVRGYFPYRLNEIFPPESNGSDTQIFKDIKKLIV